MRLYIETVGLIIVDKAMMVDLTGEGLCGRAGRDVFVRLPPGTTVTALDDEEDEEVDGDHHYDDEDNDGDGVQDAKEIQALHGEYDGDQQEDAVSGDGGEVNRKGPPRRGRATGAGTEAGRSHTPSSVTLARHKQL